ncbi:MAG: hypothetical protein KAZ36_00655, partial [Bacteroidales bacterium]|nr:hypothetical protein [Bacteroidales bacterium]
PKPIRAILCFMEKFLTNLHNKMLPATVKNNIDMQFVYKKFLFISSIPFFIIILKQIADFLKCI